MSRVVEQDDYDEEENGKVDSACTGCKLSQTCGSFPCMQGRGNRKAKIVIVGEAPGPQEAEEGRPFVGAAGKFLSRHLLRAAGIDEDELYITNAVKCFPGKDKKGKIKTPNIGQIRACRQNLYEELHQLQPKVIVLMGNVALHGLLPIYKSKASKDEKKTAKVTGITQWQGKQIWSREFNCWVIPTFHPSALVRDYQQGFEFRTNQTITDLELAEKLSRKKTPEMEYPVSHIVDDFTKAIKVLRMMLASPKVSYDIETEDLDAREAEILGIGLGNHPMKGYYITWDCIKDNQVALSLLKQILTSKDILKITHNGAFDDRFMRFKGFPALVNWVDTMIAASLLDENFARGLKPNTFRYLNFGGYDEPLDEYRRIHRLKTYKGIPQKILGTYAGYDLAATYQLWELFLPQLEEQGLLPLYHKILMPVRKVMDDAEHTGFKVDVERANYLDHLCDKAIEKLKDQIFAAAGEEFNIKSNPQLQKILYGKLRLKPPASAKTKTGGISCNTATLKELAKQKNGKIAELLLDSKYISSQQSKFIKMICRSAWSDGRIHTSYNLVGTVTGRTSCSNPGIHNIPRDRFIRSMFTASKGRRLVEADVKSAELRILAVYSGEEFLLRAFREGRDLHTETYKIMFDKKADYVPTDDERFIAKSINFGLIYGRGPMSLAKVLGVTVEEAVRLIDLYFEKMPAVKKFLDSNVKNALVRGYVVSLFKRKRRLPGIQSDDFSESSRASRQANNSVIQSAAADYVYIVLARVSRAIKKAKLKAKIVHTVHDCVIIDTPLAEVETVKQIIQKAFETPVSIVPVKMEMDIDDVAKWGEQKPSRLEDVLIKAGVLKKSEAKVVKKDDEMSEADFSDEEEETEEVA